MHAVLLAGLKERFGDDVFDKVKQDGGLECTSKSAVRGTFKWIFTEQVIDPYIATAYRSDLTHYLLSTLLRDVAGNRALGLSSFLSNPMSALIIIIQRAQCRI